MPLLTFSERELLRRSESFCRSHVSQACRVGCQGDIWTPYRWFLGGLDLFNQAHEQDIRPRNDPLIVELFLGMGANLIVWGRKALEETCESGVDLGRKNRHF